MATRVVQITAQSIGADSGPFTISDDVLGVLDSNVPRTSILGGYSVNSDTTATQITLTSTGPCNDTVTFPIDFVVCPTGPTPTIEWYQLQKCTDLSYTTSAYYTENTFEVNDRVADSNGVEYVITQVYSSDPGGAQIQIVATGSMFCPPPPPPPEECRLNISINITTPGNIKYFDCDVNETVYQYFPVATTIVLDKCVKPSTLLPGYPMAEIANFTILDNGIPCGVTPPPPPQYYYYSGIICEGGITEYFRSSDPALQDHASIVRAWCSLCGGGSVQCFDNITPSNVVNTNDVLGTFNDCVSCTGNIVSVVGVYGSMEPCIGGTVDDYMGVSIGLSAPVDVNTTFDIVVNWVTPGNTCSNTNNSQYFQLVVEAGSDFATIIACQNGAYIPGGAIICSTCIVSCDNVNVNLTGFTC